MDLASFLSFASSLGSAALLSSRVGASAFPSASLHGDSLDLIPNPLHSSIIDITEASVTSLSESDAPQLEDVVGSPLVTATSVSGSAYTDTLERTISLSLRTMTILTSSVNSATVVPSTASFLLLEMTTSSSFVANGMSNEFAVSYLLGTLFVLAGLGQDTALSVDAVVANGSIPAL